MATTKKCPVGSTTKWRGSLNITLEGTVESVASAARS
jgi:hypothetical protein